MRCLGKDRTEESQRKKELVPAFEFSKPSPQEGADRIQQLDHRQKGITRRSSSELPMLGDLGDIRGEAKMERHSGSLRKGNAVPCSHHLKVLVPPSP